MHHAEDYKCLYKQDLWPFRLASLPSLCSLATTSVQFGLPSQSLLAQVYMKVEGAGETKLYLAKGEIKGTGSQVVQIKALNLDGQTLGPLKLKGNTKVALSQTAPPEQPDAPAAPQAVSIQ